MNEDSNYWTGEILYVDILAYLFKGSVGYSMVKF